MEEYKIHLEPDLNDDYTIILQDYWKIASNEFINRPKQICDNYNITIGELNKIIKDFSYCKIIHGYCSDCGVVIEDKVYSQTSFREKIRRKVHERCNACETTFFKNLDAERNQHQEDEKKQLEEQFCRAVHEKRWTELSAEELEILKGIVRLKSKSLIYKEIFNGNPFDKSVWQKIGNIEKKGLVSIKRSESRSVIEFSFPMQLDQLLLINNKEFINAEIDSLSFSLTKNINKTQIKQPDYSGTLIFKRPVRLDPDVKYLYCGWINFDGSINLKIQALNNIFQNVEQGNIDTEPTHIKNILNNLFNQIEIDDLEK